MLICLGRKEGRRQGAVNVNYEATSVTATAVSVVVVVHKKSKSRPPRRHPFQHQKLQTNRKHFTGMRIESIRT